MTKQMFLIPDTRLVRVEYWRDGTQYAANIPNPKSNDGLQVAMLAKHVSMRQIARVQSVKENCPRS